MTGGEGTWQEENNTLSTENTQNTYLNIKIFEN